MLTFPNPQNTRSVRAAKCFALVAHSTGQLVSHGHRLGVLVQRDTNVFHDDSKMAFDCRHIGAASGEQRARGHHVQHALFPDNTAGSTF